MSDYISYKMIPSVLKIEKGDVVLLTSDITDLFLQCQDNGEILDVNGDCGGYNLQWAASSAMTAAREACSA